MPPCLAFITLDPVLSWWVAVVFSTHRAVTYVVGGRTWHGFCASSPTGSGPARYWSILDDDFFHDLFLTVADGCVPTLSVTSFLYGDNNSDFLAFFRLFPCVIASEALLVSGKIARAFLGARAVSDLVQHVCCYIEQASMLFSKIVSLIRVFLFCRAVNRHYYIVLGFPIHEHITAWSTSYRCSRITVK